MKFSDAAGAGKRRARPDLVAKAVTVTPVGTIHVIAQCGDCPWRDEDYNKAEQTARRHAKSTGHTVSVERGQCWTFNLKN